MSNERIKNLIPCLLTIAVIGIMTGAAELLGEIEIIFPEITAVAIGALIAPVQSWNASRARILISITAMSVVGVLIVRYVPIPLMVKIPLAFACAAAGLMISKTGFAPMISACVLPVILSTETFVYTASVAVMTGIILAIQYVLERLGLRTHRDFVPQSAVGKTVVYWLKHTVIIALAAVIPVLTGEMYFIVPPLIVGYVEMSSPGSPLRARYKTAVALIFIAACAGVFCRLVVTETIGFPLTVSAVLSGTVVILAVKLTKLYFPPCGAICTLPMLLGADKLWLYPLEATAGFIVLTLVALNLFGKRKVSKDDN